MERRPFDEPLSLYREEYVYIKTLLYGIYDAAIYEQRRYIISNDYI